MFRTCLLLLMASFFVCCKSNKELTQNDGGTPIPASMQSRVIVTPNGDRTIEEIESGFTKYELKHLAVTSVSENKHLFEFNSSKISTEDLLKKLNRSKLVYLAEAMSFSPVKAELMQGAKPNKPASK